MSLNKEITLKDIKNMSRKQRHDFANTLQIIYGYLQLDKKENAIAEIHKATNITHSISELYKISVYSIGLFLESKLIEVNNLGKNLTLEVETSYEEQYREIENEEEIINKMNNTIAYLINFDKSGFDDQNIESHIKIVENSDSLQIICLNYNVPNIYNQLESIKNIYSELKIIDDEIVLEFKYRKVRNIQIKDSIYSKIFSNTI